MLSAAALLEMDWRTDMLDYHTLRRYSRKATPLTSSRCTEGCVSMCSLTTAMTMPETSAGSMKRNRIAGIHHQLTT